MRRRLRESILVLPPPAYKAAKTSMAQDGTLKEEEEEAQDDGEEPEDDFNAAWEVLDLARLNYEKRKDESDAIKLKLAETYIALGDVSLETGAFRPCSLTLKRAC